MSESWTQAEAVKVCEILETVAPSFGCHVALTGGCLYKSESPRKDCDVLFYRVRQTPKINTPGLFDAMRTLGFTDMQDYGWNVKFKLQGRSIDCFFPERSDDLPKRQPANSKY